MRALLKVGFSLLVLAFVLIGLSYSMLRAQGISGPSNPEGRMIASETRNVGKDVVAVDLNGPIDLTLRQGAVASLTVRGEQRMLGNIETSVDGATLHIGTRGMLLHHRQPLQAILVLPSVERLHVRGSGDSVVDGFFGPRADVQLNGSGSIKFNGRYKEVRAGLHGSGELEMNGGSSDKVEAELVGSGNLTLLGASKLLNVEQTGSGDLHAQHLAAERAELALNGSGSAEITASNAAAVTLHGSGDVEVFGNPGVRSVSRTGSGNVTFEE